MRRPHAQALISILLWGALASQAATVYSVQNLGALGTGWGTVSGINSSGAAVGFVTNSAGVQVPVCFNCGPLNPANTLGQANAVNDRGAVVGSSLGAVTEWSNGQSTGVYVNGSQPLTGSAMAINNAGQIAGGYQAPNTQTHAFIWTNGTLKDLGTLPGGNSSAAYGINTFGAVAGYGSTASGTFHALFSNGNGLKDLGTFGGANSYGMAIDDAGEVVGSAQTSPGNLNAFEWNSSTGLVNLGTLGGTQSYAYGINNSGSIVGYSLTADGLQHAFLYSTGPMLDLNNFLPLNSGWTINAAYGINASGDIVATATSNGQSFAVELAPSAGALNSSPALPLTTPEPAAVMLAGLGLLILGKLRRK